MGLHEAFVPGSFLLLPSVCSSSATLTGERNATRWCFLGVGLGVVDKPFTPWPLSLSLPSLFRFSI